MGTKVRRRSFPAVVWLFRNNVSNLAFMLSAIRYAGNFISMSRKLRRRSGIARTRKGDGLRSFTASSISGGPVGSTTATGCWRSQTAQVAETSVVVRLRIHVLCVCSPLPPPSSTRRRLLLRVVVDRSDTLSHSRGRHTSAAAASSSPGRAQCPPSRSRHRHRRVWSQPALACGHSASRCRRIVSGSRIGTPNCC